MRDVSIPYLGKADVASCVAPVAAVALRSAVARAATQRRRRRAPRSVGPRTARRIAMAPPAEGVAFSPLDMESPKTRAQGVLEAAQAPPSAPPVAPAVAAQPTEAAPPHRSWLGVTRSALASPYTNAVALRDAPSELWVCFWCAPSAGVDASSMRFS